MARSLSDVTAETVDVIHGRPLRASYDRARRLSFGIKGHASLVRFVSAAAEWEERAIAYGHARIELASLSERVDPVSDPQWPETVSAR